VWNYTSTPHYAFIAWCSVKKHGDKFIFLLFNDNGGIVVYDDIYNGGDGTLLC
jgi:hypothetical protein